MYVCMFVYLYVCYKVETSFFLLEVSLIHPMARAKFSRNGFTLRRKVHQYVNFTWELNPVSKNVKNIYKYIRNKNHNCLALVMHMYDNCSLNETGITIFW